MKTKNNKISHLELKKNTHTDSTFFPNSFFLDFLAQINSDRLPHQELSDRSCTTT